MTTSLNYMQASDAFSWYMERDPALRSTVVVVDWLDRAPDWDVLVDRIDRISRLMPSLRQRVIETPFRLTVPRWSYDPHFDLHWHLSRVAAPPPGTRDAVLALARRSAMAAFDRDRPLWEVTLVEGMEGGEAAFIVKLHHSLSNGVGAMRMLRLVADWQREPARLGAMPPVPSDQTPELGRRDHRRRRLDRRVRRATGLARDRDGDPRHAPLRARSHRAGPRHGGDGPLHLPDGRA